MKYCATVVPKSMSAVAEYVSLLVSDHAPIDWLVFKSASLTEGFPPDDDHTLMENVEGDEEVLDSLALRIQSFTDFR